MSAVMSRACLFQARPTPGRGSAHLRPFLSVFRALSLNLRPWIQIATVMPDFEVEVGSRGPAGGAYIADHVMTGDPLSNLNVEL